MTNSNVHSMQKNNKPIHESLHVNIISNDKNNKILEIELSGKIDDTTKLFTCFFPDYSMDMYLSKDDKIQQKLRDGLPHTLIIHCSKIKQINSTGVKSWISLFNWMEKNGITGILKEVPIIFIEKRNQIDNFFGESNAFLIETLDLVFLCDNKACNKEHVLTLDIDSLIPVLNFETNEITADISCPCCKIGSLLYDGFMEEDLSFLHPDVLKKFKGNKKVA